MSSKKNLVFVVIWLLILWLGKNEIVSYRQQLINQEPIIRSYINTCVLDFPFSACRFLYNKLTLAVPERILSLIAPLSVENIFLQGKPLVLLVLFPAYLIGVFALFFRLRKYNALTLTVFTSLLINLLLQQGFFFNFIALPIIFCVGAAEIYYWVKRNYEK